MAERDVVSDRVLTVPNVISLVRLLMVPVFAVLIAAGHDGWALVVLAVSGASDWLDGVLARRLGQVSRLGQVLDRILWDRSRDLAPGDRDRLVDRAAALPLEEINAFAKRFYDPARFTLIRVEAR